jgi:hypothetical protein
MIANAELPDLTPKEYLEWETDQTLKYEYVNGEVFAMAGGTIPHNDIASQPNNRIKKIICGVKAVKCLLLTQKLRCQKQGLFIILMSW